MTNVQTGFAWLGAFAIGLLVFLVYEVCQWRRTRAVLSSRQRLLRVVNIGLLLVLVLLLGVLLSGAVRSPVRFAVLLTVILVLMLVVLALGVRDMRELRATRDAKELKIAGDLARFIAAQMTPKPARPAEPPSEEEMN